MERCSLYCVTLEKTIECDILEINDKRIKVAPDGINETIILFRKDMRYPYVGNVGNIEFETFGEIDE